MCSEVDAYAEGCAEPIHRGEEEAGVLEVSEQRQIERERRHQHHAAAALVVGCHKQSAGPIVDGGRRQHQWQEPPVPPGVEEP
jgi:hypothetical protein